MNRKRRNRYMMKDTRTLGAHVRIHAHTHTHPLHTQCMCIWYVRHSIFHRFKTVCMARRQSKRPDNNKKSNSFAPNCLCLGTWPGEQRRRSRYDSACVLHVAPQCTEQIYPHRRAPCQSHGCGQHLRHGHFVIVQSRKAPCSSLHAIFYTICIICNEH